MRQEALPETRGVQFVTYGQLAFVVGRDGRGPLGEFEHDKASSWSYDYGQGPPEF